MTGAQPADRHLAWSQWQSYESTWIGSDQVIYKACTGHAPGWQLDGEGALVGAWAHTRSLGDSQPCPSSRLWMHIVQKPGPHPPAHAIPCPRTTDARLQKGQSPFQSYMEHNRKTFHLVPIFNEVIFTLHHGCLGWDTSNHQNWQTWFESNACILLRLPFQRGSFTIAWFNVTMKQKQSPSRSQCKPASLWKPVPISIPLKSLLG